MVGAYIVGIYNAWFVMHIYLNLYFSSYHPPHVFRSILYSQALRYRRIINDDVLLSERLDELKIAFKNSGYPIGLIDDVIDPIKNHPRVLDYKNKNDLEKSFKVPWVQTFGSGYVAGLSNAKNFLVG